MFLVTFNFIDDMQRKTQRSWVNANALIADVLTDVGTLAPLLDAVTEGGLQSVNISLPQPDTAEAFAAQNTSNIDDNASLTVSAADGRNYPFDLPMPVNALKQNGGTINVANSDLLALMAAFDGQTGNNWRINRYNPTVITGVISGKVDK